MAQAIEVSMHHIRVDVKFLGNYFSYEYDVPEKIWDQYFEKLNGKKTLAVLLYQIACTGGCTMRKKNLYLVGQ